MAKHNVSKSIPTFNLGDYVQIRHSGYHQGRIVELRGPLGPEGVQIYRIRVQEAQPLGVKAKPIFIELREDQLSPIEGSKVK